MLTGLLKLLTALPGLVDLVKLIIKESEKANDVKKQNDVAAADRVVDANIDRVLAANTNGIGKINVAPGIYKCGYCGSIIHEGGTKDSESVGKSSKE